MNKFIGRQQELNALNAVLTQRGAQFILLYGRRRVGKTTLVLHWAEQSGRPFIYWVSTRDTPAQIRASFMKSIWAWAYPTTQGGGQAVPRFESWSEVFALTAQLIGDQPVVLILDEFSYATESDPSLPSHLQAAWDHLFKKSNITLVLAGSHIGMMVDLLRYQAPLYGRFTAQLPVDPLPFGVIADFLPQYTAEERVAVYAVAGGIPAYIERFNDAESVDSNLQRLFMLRTSMFHSEPFMLIGDVIRRETQRYEAILKALAAGKRTPNEISQTLGLTASELSPYLKQLEGLRLVERRLPATLEAKRRRNSRNSRYHLVDAYLRFYFRFIAPNFDLVEQELTTLLWERIREQFRAFIGVTAFEELCRAWTLGQARVGALPFMPELVGSHWSTTAQVDVIAINWREQAILLGECKWLTEPVSVTIVRELVRKSAAVVPGPGWQVHYVLFARNGFTPSAIAEAQTVGAQLIDLVKLDRDLTNLAKTR
ncbi:MAG: ATP-binding protein [Caldilinea sp. CFX5]|nr:ATP-binding protein [Caldilinea sp. CFX5]